MLSSTRQCATGKSSMAIVITDAAVRRYGEIAENLRKTVRDAIAAGNSPVSMEALETWLVQNRRDLILKVATEIAAEAEVLEVPEEWTPTRRTERNLAAMRLIATKNPAAMNAQDRAVLAAYSGWGGLSIDDAKAQFPPSLEVDPESLIHEYYTPFSLCQEIARACQPLLDGIVGMDGVIRALEPSAGIGRFIRAFDALPSKPPIRWTAVELSALAGNLLAAARPGTEVVVSSFETWISRHSSVPFNFVIANPPFGERGAHRQEDPNREYRENQAAAYFVRRGLDALTAGGLGVWIIPAGYMTDARRTQWRTRVLQRHHLLAAFRLPSHVRSSEGKLRPLFPGTQNVTDVLFFRRRPGELETVDEADRSIVEGNYFDEIPGHVLGTVDPSAGQYKVIGPPVRFPNLLPRPICESCRLKLAEPEPASDEVTEVPESPKMDAARALGQRVSAYLAAVARRDPAAGQQWAELHAGLMDWSRNHGSPFATSNLRELAGETDFLRAWDVDGRLIPTLQTAPQVDLGKLTALRDPVALAGYLWAQERGLTIARLMAVLSDQGQTASRQDVLTRLFSAGWCVDGPGLQLLQPRDAYLSGDLWRRLEYLAGAPDHPRTALQRDLLRAQIPPVLLADLGDYSPRLGWVPSDLIERFAVEVLSAATMRLERRQGFISPQGVEYETLDPSEKNAALTPDAIAFLGWLNHDLSVFRPKRGTNKSLLEEREERAGRWEADFRDWIAKDGARARALLDAYQKRYRGYRRPSYSTDPIALVRWTDDPKAQLHDYQRAGVRRIVENRGGILSYDVGVGKTFTALAAVALLRQEGIVKRPIILVPNSLIFQWLAEIKRVLPDYRVGLIGAKLVVRQRGERRGQVDSTNDTGLERASKWARFQGGEFDVVILGYSAMPRTRIDIDAAEEMFQTVSAVAREIRISRRALNRRDPDKLTEREQAIKAAKTAGWIQRKLELPESWAYDGDIVWDTLGCDFLVVDEFHNFKNLFMPDARERGLPAFMGSGGDGSDRAWQLFFRTAAVRRFTGGGGVLGLTATPAKNGPTELFSAFAVIDPNIWAEYGIGDAEQFIDQFCLLEPRPVVTTSMTIEVRDAMIGFQNLPDLRSILERYIDFMSAREAAESGKLKKPKATALSVPLQQDDDQRRKLADMLDSLRKQVEIQLGKPDETGKTDEAQQGKAADGGLLEKPSAPDLGMIARLGLIAIHAQLDEGYTLNSAVDGGIGKNDQQLPAPRSFQSPKFNAVADRVVAESQCGHIVFLEPLAAQAWLREVLVQRGVPRERIALLNAQTAKSGTDRLKIATDFNEGKYVVVIANSVAGEGANLQRRTCAVHCVDIPWDPMTRRQRIGRADRQGNELGKVTVYDYLTLNSGDGPRFHKLMGKGTWIEMVMQTKDDISINPAAQISLSPIELLADLTNDPEESKRLLREIEAKEALRKKLQVRTKIGRLLRSINDRYRTAEMESAPENAAVLRDDAKRMLDEMEQFDPTVWPFLDLARRVEFEPIVATDTALPLWSGLRLDNGTVGVEIGRVEGGSVGVRRRGAYLWEKKTGLDLTRKAFPLFEPADYARPWRPEKPIDLSDRMGSLTFEQFLAFNWSWASEDWLRSTWPAYEPILRSQLMRRNAQQIPAKSREGELYLANGRALESLVILSPGAEGWAEFVRLAPSTDHPRTDLERVAERWWDRSLPQPRVRSSSRGPTDLASSRGPLATDDPALAELLTTLEPDVAEQLLPLHRKRRAVREALAILLPQRGVKAFAGTGIRGELVVTDKPGKSRYTLPANALLSAERVDPKDDTLEGVTALAVSDVSAVIERERAAHGDAAFELVLSNLQRDPTFYDATIESFRPKPEPEPEPAPVPENEPESPIAVVGSGLGSSSDSSNLRLHTIFHSKRGKHLPLVEVLQRVGEDEYARLLGMAEARGGYYSSYRRAGVPRGFIFKTPEDAQDFIRAVGKQTPARIPTPTSDLGHAYQVGGEWYGDTNFVQMLGRAGYSLDHIGGGDFQAKGPSGVITVYRYADASKSPEQVGRLHSLGHTAGVDALENVIADMESAGTVAILGPWGDWPAPTKRPTGEILTDVVKEIRKTLETRTRLGGDDSRVLDLALAVETDGWPAGMPVGRVTIHHSKDPDGWDWDDLSGAFRKHNKKLGEQQLLKVWVARTVEEASRVVRGAAPTEKRGSAYRVAGNVYLDGRAVKLLGQGRRVEDAAKGLTFVEFDGVRLELTQAVDDAGLPGEEGPLHRLKQTDMLPRLIDAKIADLRGEYSEWPSERSNK